MPTDRQQKRRHVARSCAHYNLKRTERTLTAIYDKALSPLGLHITQFTLLVTSSGAGSQSIRELADLLAMDQSTLSRNLRPLVTRGLLDVKADKEDARAKRVSITDAGERLIDEVYPLWVQAQEEVKTLFEEEEYGVFLNHLNRFNLLK